MRYCNRCVMPDTKPGIQFDAEGICSACRSVEKKHAVNWDERAEQLRSICDEIRGSKGHDYECIVPVSGGKDSCFQVYMMSQVYKLRTLAVVVAPHLQTAEGIENLNAMCTNLGVDLIKINVRAQHHEKNPPVGLFENRQPQLCRASGRVCWRSSRRDFL